MNRSILIAPSILSSDFSRLADEVQAVERAGADWIHVDVMDGHFVPNITIGPDVVKAIRPHATKPLDVHLMIAPVDPYLESFARAGADTITIHVEATPDVGRSLAAIRALGRKAGLTLKPGTPASAVAPFIEQVDMVLVMSVEPGFGGQSFIPESLGRIAQIRSMIGERHIPIEVDGGVLPENASKVAAAGASVLVAGTAVFRGGPMAYAANIEAIREAATF